MRLADLLGPPDRRLNPKGGCHSCPLKKVDFVPPTLKKTKLLALGEAPGENEVKQGEGFVGESGQLLREVAAIVELGDFSLSNTIHCRPPKNRTPTAKEVGCCLNQFVLSEIEGYKYVLMLGNVPMTALFPKIAADKLRGNLAYHPDFPNTRFFGTYHPSYILRFPRARETFERHLRRLSRIINHGESEAPFTIRTGSSGMDYLENAISGGMLSIDIETGGKESWTTTARVKSIAAAGNTREAFFVHEDEAHFIAALEMIKKFLSDPSSRAVGQNFGFDGVFLEAELGFRIRSRNVWDIQSLYYVSRADKMIGLKELVARELDGYRHLVPWPFEEVKQNTEWLGKYNSEDVIYPLMLLEKGLQGCHPKTVDLFLRVAGPSSLHLRRMQHYGIGFDSKLWKQAAEDTVEKRRKLLEQWSEDDPQFIPAIHANGDGLIEYLYDVKKYPVLERTPTEKPSTDASVIKRLSRQKKMHQEDNRPLEHLLTLKTLDKEENTYITPYNDHVWPDGIVRSSYFNTVTDSGRRSSRNPNTQNLPRLGITRRFFIARPGYVLLAGDLSQIELRIAMCLAKDPVGLAAYLRGDDLHTETARAISGKEKPTKEERSRAKPVNFASLYGAHWTRLKGQAADDYGIWLTDEEAEEYQGAFFRRYQRLRPWHEETHQELRDNRGNAMHAAGHCYFYADWNHEDQGRRDHAFRAHLNSKCQGPAAYINMYILILVDRMITEARLDAHVVHEEHDSVITECRPNDVEQVAEMYKMATAQTAEWIKDWFIVPLVTEFEVGPSRGELKEHKF